MGRYLAILSGAADEADKSGLTDRQQAELMQAWASWARANERALVDPGAPLYAKKRLTSEGVEDITDGQVAYAIVEASSHDEALRIFSEHPHLRLHDGNSVSVMECPPGPTRH